MLYILEENTYWNVHVKKGKKWIQSLILNHKIYINIFNWLYEHVWMSDHRIVMEMFNNYWIVNADLATN